MHQSRSFQQVWIAETLRLREAQAGPLHDRAQVRHARALAGTFSDRILLRAQLLGQRENLGLALQRWSWISRWALLGLLLLAALGGVTSTLAVLGDTGSPVNLLLGLVVLLGPHIVSFLLWLATLRLHTHNAGAWLGRLWLSVTRHFVRGTDGALAPQALAALLARRGVLRWALGAISHLLWLTAQLSMLSTLLLLLSTRRYTFNWETTLLGPDSFVMLTQVIGWLPSKMGFAMPPTAIIQISDGLTVLPSSAHALWSSWLIGCLVVYGMLPRLVALIFSAALSYVRTRGITQLDTSLPGYANLRPRLMPTSEPIEPDAAPGPELSARLPGIMSQTAAGEPVIMGLELAPDQAWPPADLPTNAQDAGVIDTRAQRNQIVDSLQIHPVTRLLIVCDHRQTPDRGTLNTICELAAYAGQTGIAFLPAPEANEADTSRLAIWHEKLQACQLPATAIYDSFTTALRWLEEGRNDIP